ncbi:hypothetical protein M066_2696 [Bacteroides fragilis str. I1345]|nr:hypothetical protein M085_2333 [Bacteroides fragilis str. 3986 N(B)19]EYB18492.1 hypothetical protein M066_2696 [Bacteroides fragilis str. I1345]
MTGSHVTTDYTDFHRLIIYFIENQIKASVLIRVICGEYLPHLSSIIR